MSDISVQTVTCSGSEAAVGDGGFLGEGLADLGGPPGVEVLHPDPGRCRGHCKIVVTSDEENAI